MAVVALTRLSGVTTQGSVDSTWNMIWQHVEACIAVTMVSLTAFRSVFISTDSAASPRQAKPWHPLRIGRIGGQQRDNVLDANAGRLPSIPSATLTGMRTFIQGDSCQDTELGNDHLRNSGEQGIMVTRGIRSETREVRIFAHQSLYLEQNSGIAGKPT